MAVGATAGSKLYIAPPGASPSPDIFEEVGEINDLGSVGPNYTPITITSIGNRNERTLKGTKTSTQLQVKVNRDPEDAGQALIKTAADSDDDYNFKIVLNDDIAPLTNPTTITFQGKVMSYTVDMGGPNNPVGATVNIGVNPATYNEVSAS